MTRHARNCTAGAVYTYHEKKRDTKASGYGSNTVRVGKDSGQEFDCCCLTLQPCRNPVVTSDGYLYDKEAVLEYIIHQKRLIAKQLKAFDKQQMQDKKELEELGKAEQESKLQKFCTKQTVSKPEEGCSEDSKPGPSKGSHSSAKVTTNKDKHLPSFWIPSLTPQAKKSQLKKPEEKVRCPMSGKPLRLKDLLDIKFKEIQDGGKKSLITKDARYVCAVTNDVLGNSVPCAVLKTSGVVVTVECVDKLIRKDMRDPINGKPMKDSDILPLQRGSSGFSGAGGSLVAKKDGPALMA